MINIHLTILFVQLFILGLCIGSFLNVCIYRIPSSIPFLKKRSICLSCKKQIKLYDNIPILSYFLLRGRCRDCKARIPFRYVIVELLSGLIMLCVILKFHFTLTSLFYLIFIYSLIIITFIDIDYQIIPDSISIPGIIIGVLFSLTNKTIPFKDSILGLLVGGGSLILVILIYYIITKTEGMGGGDVKLLAMIGAFIGWKGVIFTIFIASLFGTIVGIMEMIRKQKNMKLAIPFGPFLACSAIMYIFFGKEIIYIYFVFLSNLYS